MAIYYSKSNARIDYEIKKIIDQNSIVINCSNMNIDEVIKLSTDVSLFNPDEWKIFKDCNFLISKQNPKKLDILFKDKKNAYFFVQTKKIPDSLLKNSTELRKLSSSQYKDFVLNKAKQLNYEIDDDAIETLLSFSNFDITNIENNMYALKNIDKNIITKIDIVENLTDDEELNSFELITYILKQEKNQALKIFDDMMLNGDNPISIINSLAFSINNLYFYFLLKSQGKSNFQISNELKIPMFIIQKYSNISSTPDKIITLAKQLYNYDYNIKVGTIPGYNCLRLLILGYDK